MVLVLALLFNLTAFSAVHAREEHRGEPGGERSGHRYLPAGAVVWDREDFSRWLGAVYVPERAKAKLRAIVDFGELLPVVVTEKAYRAWLSTLDPAVAGKVDPAVVRISGSVLPVKIVRGDVAGEMTGIEAGADYVILAGVFCPVCKKIVGIILSWALGRWVLDPIFNWLRLLWKEYWATVCGHLSGQNQQHDVTMCPHQPWCMGSWQRVRWDDGVVAECECECGALWLSYNPLH